MKYKDMELELPPLGEVLVCMDGYEHIHLGYFYLSNGKREFQLTAFIMRGFDLGCCMSTDYTRLPKKWAELPEFKLLEKEQPPTGIEVLISCFKDGVKNYIKGVNLKDTDLNTRCPDAVVDSWIELEAFKEDK